MKRWCIMWPICMCMYVLGLLTCFFKSAHCLPVTDKETESRLTNLTGYDILTYSGRTLKAIDWEACEFGHTLQPYDETCPNGATNLLPCNPGQLKVAECIGQGGDTSRVCDPCPQKFFQSSYNRCTACHECSECRPDEQIKEPCTDETDTVCESIIAPPPPPDPTITDAPVPRLSTQIPDESTPTVQDPTTAVPSDSTTKNVLLTEGPSAVQTTQNVSSQRPDTCTSVNTGSSPFVVLFGAIAAIGWFIIFILVIVLWCTCGELKKEQRRNSDLESRLSELNVPVSSSSVPNRGLEPERSVGDCEGSQNSQSTDVVVDSPEDEKTPLSRGLHSLIALLPSNVVKDSHRSKRDGKKKKKSRVTFHNNTSGDSHIDQSSRGTSPNVYLSGLPTGGRKNLQQSRGTGKGESLQDEGTHQEPDLIPPVIRAGDDARPWNEKVPPSTITTADVYDPEDQLGERGRGDGGSLVMRDVVQDGYHSQDVLSHHGQNDNTSHQSQNEDLNWLAEKVPGSTAYPATSTNGSASSIELPPLDSKEHWHAEKVPESFALPPTSTNGKVPSTDMSSSNNDVYRHAEKVPGSSRFQEKSIRDPSTVTDAPSDDTHFEDQENKPQTLRSSTGPPEAPIAGEEDWAEDDPEATGANSNEFDNNAPNARDVPQRLTEPEATAFNNNEDNTTLPGGEMPEDANIQRKPRKRITFPFFKKQRRKTHDNLKDQPIQQMQPLFTKMDQMVEEECLEYVADELKLFKLDKLCRELGLKETEVENHKYDLKSQHCQGAEFAFKMLVKIRDSQGVIFSYSRLDEALRASKNTRVADGMVSKFQLIH